MDQKDVSCECLGTCNPDQAEDVTVSGIDRRRFMQSAALAAGSAGLAAMPVAEDANALSGPAVGVGKSQAAHRKRGVASKYAAPSLHEYNGPYEGANLSRIAFPIGGIGAGMFCVEGTGAISHMSVRNRMEFFHEPTVFAAVCVKGAPNRARVLEGPIPDRKYFGAPGTGNGAPGATYGFPRFKKARFLARFPFATIDLQDEGLPLTVTITGWSPFVPGQADQSSLPVGAIEYTFMNSSGTPVEAVFSFNAKNFLARDGVGGNSIRPFPRGFILSQDGKAGASNEGAFAVFTDAEQTVVDHCWYRGGWWDAITLAWRNVEEATLMSNPPIEGGAPGASLCVPFVLAPHARHTVRLMTAWHFPNTDIRFGTDTSDAFATKRPSRGTAKRQQPVSGFLGKGLVNTFDPAGDGAIGALISPPFRIAERYIHFLVGGGSNVEETAVQLLVDNRVVFAKAGEQTETLAWASWDVKDLRNRHAQIRIVDRGTGPWGHILVDHVIASDTPIAALKYDDGNDLKMSHGVRVLADFEGSDYADWIIDTSDETACCEAGASCCSEKTPEHYQPWYAGQFKDVESIATYWHANYDALRSASALFRDTFYDTTLPPEIVEAVAANLTILKSPTVLRQTDGRLWCFEGCGDDGGCCSGSCTHVWNYAQAIPHLFPDLERGLRHTEYAESMLSDGRQRFRANLPIRSTRDTFMCASDGQLGGIMKMYREWRISGDNQWLRDYSPRIRKSLDWMIAAWDPRETGLPEESHHNTYDINYYGPNGHIGSFYLGALTAAIRMGEALGDDVSRYRALLEKGRARLEDELFNGEYFFQKIIVEGLKEPPARLSVTDCGTGYRPVVELLNQQGPKYQYGTGCLSDGVLGFWIALMCGIDEQIVDKQKVRSSLHAIYKYNLKRDLREHANPQRPSYALGDDGGLLLCTWPRSDALAIPFVYSNEVWTGIEYQVASHLMSQGMVEEGLDIVRIARNRHDGVRRNPFNEYECGHWYARAMSSYGLLQGLTGLRYDAVEKTLHVASRGGDFGAFLCTATGYGTAGLRDGKPFLEVKSGVIDVREYVVATS